MKRSEVITRKQIKDKVRERYFRTEIVDGKKTRSPLKKSTVYERKPFVIKEYAGQAMQEIKQQKMRA